jgi:hypothetical protein
MGPCLDTIPARVRVSHNMTVSDLLQQVQDQYAASIPFENMGYFQIVGQCTDWARWERLRSIVMYQNLGESVDFLPLGDENFIKTGRIRSPSDRADTAVYTFPHKSGTWVEINFCRAVIPVSFAEFLLQKVCFYIEYLSKSDTYEEHSSSSSSVPRRLPSAIFDQSSPPIIPLSLDLLAKKPNSPEESAMAKVLSLD